MPWKYISGLESHAYYIVSVSHKALYGSVVAIAGGLWAVVQGDSFASLAGLLVALAGLVTAVSYIAVPWLTMSAKYRFQDDKIADLKDRIVELTKQAERVPLLEAQNAHQQEQINRLSMSVGANTSRVVATEARVNEMNKPLNP